MFPPLRKNSINKEEPAFAGSFFYRFDNPSAMGVAHATDHLFTIGWEKDEFSIDGQCIRRCVDCNVANAPFGRGGL